MSAEIRRRERVPKGNLRQRGKRIGELFDELLFGGGI
jgi:hypothetical protein